MSAPAYRLSLGDRVVDTTSEPRASTLLELDVDQDMNGTIGSFALVLAAEGGIEPAVDDAAKLELGFAESGLETVFGGRVESVEPALMSRRVLGRSSAAALARTYVEETHRDKRAGEIVRALAGAASVVVDRADDGILFPAYVVDARRSAFDHVRDLAELCGFDVYFTPDDELRFAAFAPAAVHLFEYSRHVLDLEVRSVRATAASVEAWGESPARGGDESWAWLTKDFSGSVGRAGSGAPARRLERPVLRTRDAASAAAGAARRAIDARATRGRLLTVGRPDVRLGEAARVSGAPQSELNRQFQIRRVRHRLSADRGFVTEIELRGV